MTDDPEDDIRNTRKLLEERANKLIEDLQEMRSSMNGDLSKCRSFLTDQINVFFDGIEQRKRKMEAMSDDVAKDSLMDLMRVLERIDCLIGEIDTCKRTVTKLNNLLLKENKDE